MNRQKRESCQLPALPIILFIISLVTHDSLAETPQEMTQLANGYILKHLDKQIHNAAISIMPLSANAQTPHCQRPPQVSWSNGQRVGNVSLTISCSSPPWQRYINAKISGELPVVVTNNDLALGANLSATDVRLDWLPSSQVRNNHLTTLTDIDNLSTRQFISAGTPLTSNQLRARVLIHKGDQVRILAGSDSFAIEMAGTALDSGEKNKQIRVQNISSGKIIKGNIVSADSVIVP